MRHHHEAGQTLPFVAIVVVVLLAFIGLAVDAGYLFFEQRNQQTAADSAAIAAAYEKMAGTSITTAAQNATAQNGYTNNGTSVIVTATSPPIAISGDPYNGNASAVEVLVKAQQPTFFMRVFGFTTVPVTTRAVALTTPTDNNCVTMLTPGANTNFNKGTVIAPSCGLQFNGSANFNGATVDAKSIGCNSGCSGGTYTLATPQPMAPVPDPCLQIAGCAALTNSPPIASGCITGPGSGTANPGCYSSWPINGNLTLNPGLYIINGALTAPGGKALTITNTGGVTIYVTNSGSLDFGKATVTLTACTTTITPNIACVNNAVNNILFFQPPSNTNAPNFNKSSNALTGVVYFPSCSVNFNKTGGGYAMFIFGSGNFNNGTETFSGPASGGFYAQQAVLAE